MNEKQKKFAEFYAGDPNATEAAKAAGYSKKTARSQGQRLLTNVDILRYIKELQDNAAQGRISSITQTKAFWSDIMNDETEKTSDRLKASELLAKSAGAFVHTSSAGDNDDYAGEDVIIYVPQVKSEEEVRIDE